MRLLLYSSGHGFGHAARDVQVLHALRAIRPDARIHVRTTVADWFLDHSLGTLRCERSTAALDVGVLQADSLSQDAAATRDACRALLADRDALLAQERAFLAEWRPDMVLADVPAIPLAAAASLGLPAVAMSNFSWDWIYSEYPGLEELADAFARDYARADVLLRLPFHGGDEATRAFGRVEDVPMVARRSALSIDEARERLGLGSGRALILVSFGGLGPGAFDWSALEAFPDFFFILTPPLRGALPNARPRNVTYVENDALTARGMAYPDLVRACDVVVTKPGYGIVSECLANETRVLYTERGTFAEYDFLVEGLERHGVARRISNEDLAAGRWGAHLEALLAQPRRPCRMDVDGAEQVARRLVERVR